jgi:hypothetical protein
VNGTALHRLLRAATRSPLALCCAAIGGVVWSAASVRAEVEFVPKVTAGIAHIDNLYLTTANPQTETVYELVPGFTLSQMSPRVIASAAYQLEGYHYKNLGETSTYHVFDGTFSAALDPDNFFVDLGASRGQSIRNPDAPLPRTNLPISNNRVNRDDVYAGLHFQYPFGANATAQGSERHDRTRYTDISSSTNTDPLLLNDLTSDAVSFSFDNYRKQKGFSWAARYNDQKADYNVGGVWEHRQASVELGSWFGRGFRVFVSGGKESAWDQPFDPTLRDRFWEAGFSKQAGDNFSAEIAAGDRSFGASRRASLNANFEHFNTRFSYTEEPTTSNQDRYSGLLQPELPPDFLARLGSTERYIRKRLLWTGGLTLRRASIAVTAFDESRQDRFALDGTPLPQEDQRGGTLTGTWSVGARTDLVLGVSNARRHFAAAEDRNLRYWSFAANHRVGSRTRATLEYLHTKDGAAGIDGYSSNVLSVLLTRTWR